MTSTAYSMSAFRYLLRLRSAEPHFPGLGAWGLSDKPWNSVAFVTTLTIIGIFADYAVHALMARTVETEEYGDYAAAYAGMVIIGAVIMLGAERTATKFLPQYDKDGKRERIAGFILFFAVAAIVVGLAIGLAGLLAGLSFPFKGGDFFQSDAGHPILIGLWFVPAYALVRLFGGVLNAFGRPAWSAGVYRLGVPLLMAGLLALLLAVETDIRSVHLVLVFAAACAIGIVVAIAGLPRGTPLVGTRPHFMPKAWLAVSLPIMAVEILWKAGDHTGTLMLEVLSHDEKEVGLFAATQKAGYLIMTPYLATIAVVLPKLGLIAEGADNLPARQALYGKVTRQLAIWVSIAALPLVLFPSAILGLYGGDYAAAKWVLIVSAVAYVLTATFGIGAYFLQFCGHGRLGIYCILAGIAVYLLGCLALIGPFASMGAAVAFLVSAIVMEALLVYYIWSRIGLVPFLTRSRQPVAAV